jgi:hypothetical protein
MIALAPSRILELGAQLWKIVDNPLDEKQFPPLNLQVASIIHISATIGTILVAR